MKFWSSAPAGASAVAWTTRASEQVQKRIIARQCRHCVTEFNCENALANNVEQWLALAKNEKVGMTVVIVEPGATAGCWRGRCLSGGRSEDLRADAGGPRSSESSKDFAQGLHEAPWHPDCGMQRSDLY